MQRRSFIALSLVSFIACAPSVTIDPLPAESSESAIVVTGTAPPLAAIAIRGGASKVETTSDAQGRYMTYVALAPDRENTLTADLAGRAAAANDVNRRTIRHKSPDVSSYLAQSRVQPALRLSEDARVSGLIATLTGETDPLAVISASGGSSAATIAADGNGRFELAVTLKQEAESELIVVARSKAGIESAPLSIHVAPAMTAVPPPIPAIDPSLHKTTSSTGFTIRGASAAGMKVRVEEAGTIVAEGFADATGAFALGVQVKPQSTTTFAVSSVNHIGTQSAPSYVKIAWSGQAPASQYPIVLVHGMGGFDSILGYEYFYGIADRLRAIGYEVYVASLSPLATPAVRAQQLKQQIQGWTSGKVNLIAHSQGTLDSRYMISKLGMGPKVASYTSIAGPHRGSRVADVAVGLIPGQMQQAIDFLIGHLGMDWGAIQEITEQNMVNVFNPNVPDDPNVYYQSYTGIADPFGDDTGTALSAYLVAPWTVLAIADGADNDGLVTIPSAKWGNFKGTMAADHITEVGQVFGLTTFDFRKFYENIALDLTARGF